MDQGGDHLSIRARRRDLLEYVGGAAALGTLADTAAAWSGHPGPTAPSATGLRTTGYDAGGWTAYRGSSRRAGINASTTGPDEDFELAWLRELDVEPIETDDRSPWSTADAGLDYQFDGSAQYAPPAVADERVFVSTPRSVHCLNLLTGGEVWRVDVENRVVTQPSLDAERAYVGTNRDTGPPDYEEIGEIVALDRSDGTVQWRTEPASLDVQPKLSTAPVVADGTVYATTVPSSETRTGTGIVALDAATGEERWAGSADGYRAVGLAVEDDWVTTTNSGYYSPSVFMLRDEDEGFSNAWSWEAGTFKTPAIRNGVAYYTRDSSYHVLTAGSGDVVRESANAAHEWFGEGQSPPVIDRDRVYRFFWGSDEAPPRILALDGRTGDVVWRTDPEFSDDAKVGQLTAAAGVLYLTHGVGDATNVRAFDPETGDQRGEHLIDAETSPVVPVAPGLLALVEYVDVEDGILPRVRVVDGTQSERPKVTDEDVGRRWCAARATAGTVGNDLTAGDAATALVDEIDSVRDDDSLSNAERAELLDRIDWGAGATLQAHRLFGEPGDGGELAAPPGACDADALRRLTFPGGEIDLIETTLQTAIAMIQETVALKDLLEEAAEEVEIGQSLLAGAGREADSLGSYVDEVVLAGGDDVFEALYERRGAIEDRALQQVSEAAEMQESSKVYRKSIESLVSEVRSGVRSALLGEAQEDVGRVTDGLGPSAVGGTGPSTGYSGAGVAFQHGYDSMTATATFAAELMNNVLTLLTGADYISAVAELRDYLEGDEVDPLTLFGLVEPLLGFYGQIAKVLAAAAATAVGGLALRDVAGYQAATVTGVIEGAPQ